MAILKDFKLNQLSEACCARHCQSCFEGISINSYSVMTSSPAVLRFERLVSVYHHIPAISRISITGNSVVAKNKIWGFVIEH